MTHPALRLTPTRAGPTIEPFPNTIWSSTMDDKAELGKERQIMRAMRKTLTSVVRDCAPRADRPSPLSPDTVENIRMCLGLIAARECELAEALGLSRNERPHFVDETPAVQPLDFLPSAKKH